MISETIAHLATARQGVEALLKRVKKPVPELEVLLAELRQAESAASQLAAQLDTLQSERQRYAELFDHAPDGYLLTDCAGVVVEANQVAGNLLGLHPEALVGRPLLQFVSEQAQHDFSARLVQISSGKLAALRGWQVEMKPFGVGSLPVDIDLAVAHDGQTDPCALRWILRDVSERRKLDDMAAQRNHQLSALSSATAALLKTLDLEKLLGEILDAALAAIPAAEKGRLHLVVPDTGELQLRAFTGFSDPRIRKYTHTGSTGLLDKALRERRPLRLEQVPVTLPLPGAERIPELESIRSSIVVPLVLNEQALGALQLDSSQPIAFNDGDLGLLSTFANAATAAIHNAQLHAEVQRLAVTDALTGLYNRHGLFMLGRREFERALRFQRPLAVLMLDLDLFKQVNDTFGHAAGDQVLQAVAYRCSHNIREFDIIGRYGGEEFVLLLPETEIGPATEVAERLRLAVAAVPVPFEGQLIPVTVSLGVVSLTPLALNLEALVQQADVRMYLAKRNGRNRVEAG